GVALRLRSAPLRGSSRTYSAFFFSSSLMASTTFFEVGGSFDSKRLTTLPSRPTRNLTKFHLISPLWSGLVSFSVRNLYKGVLSSPLTVTLDSITNLTPYLLVQNSEISLSLPGSCLPKSLAGTPITTSPSLL